MALVEENALSTDLADTKLVPSQFSLSEETLLEPADSSVMSLR